VESAAVSHISCVIGSTRPLVNHAHMCLKPLLASFLHLHPLPRSPHCWLIFSPLLPSPCFNPRGLSRPVFRVAGRYEGPFKWKRESGMFSHMNYSDFFLHEKAITYSDLPSIVLFKVVHPAHWQDWGSSYRFWVKCAQAAAG